MECFSNIFAGLEPTILIKNVIASVLLCIPFPLNTSERLLLEKKDCLHLAHIQGHTGNYHSAISV